MLRMSSDSELDVVMSWNEPTLGDARSAKRAASPGFEFGEKEIKRRRVDTNHDTKTRSDYVAGEGGRNDPCIRLAVRQDFRADPAR